uniref:Uncharacterized protein n=1 Tax=Rhizophora mucronata TaxID=61149 RepID=A0A2P2QDN5_RHIMU
MFCIWMSCLLAELSILPIVFSNTFH